MASPIRICHASDLHGRWPTNFRLPEADLYLLTGDLLPDLWTHDNEWPIKLVTEQRQKLWAYKKDFRAGLGSPDAPVALVRGNHDFYDIGKNIGGDVFEVKDAPARVATFCGLKIGGMRGILPVGGGHWNDEKSEAELGYLLEKVPKDIEVLLTHTPPFGILDHAHGDFLGSRELSKALVLNERFPSLRLHAFGHIHESNGLVRQPNPGPNPDLDWGEPVIFSNAACGYRIIKL